MVVYRLYQDFHKSRIYNGRNRRIGVDFSEAFTANAQKKNEY
ncbi:MAG: hypothetical protein CM15mP130_2250 [Verrucomicrobiota bacterium]|nr:MAG: hypothetical protein CM15mP130_2250 [Verrucomicrobiota bacterium]